MPEIMLNDYDVLGQNIALSDVDILGDDAAAVMESLGAIHPGQADALARSMALARHIDPDAVAVRRQAMRRMGIQGAGTNIVLFTAVAATQQVELRVSRPFKPTEIIIPSEIAPFFRIQEISVNGVNQIASSGPIPCTALSEVAFRPKMKLDTVNPSFPLSMLVTMTDLTVSREFSSLFVGWALLK
mgnify:CR=1 FL=1